MVGHHDFLYSKRPCDSLFLTFSFSPAHFFFSDNYLFIYETDDEWGCSFIVPIIERKAQLTLLRLLDQGGPRRDYMSHKKEILTKITNFGNRRRKLVERKLLPGPPKTASILDLPLLVRLKAVPKARRKMLKLLPKTARKNVAKRIITHGVTPAELSTTFLVKIFLVSLVIFLNRFYCYPFPIFLLFNLACSQSSFPFRHFTRTYS